MIWDFKFRFVFPFLLFVGLICAQTNVPPEIIATGDQSYCSGNPINIATDFDIIDPDDTGIEAFFIQISEGYTFGEDVLLLTGNHPNIGRTWDPVQGKLTFFSIVPSTTILYADLIAAVRDVVYTTTPNTERVDKIFSFTIGDANFLPSTGHFYEYIPNFGITWTQARAAAASSTYFGLQGYLATVTSPEEAQITGEQAAGAGWIGGTDAATEGVWQWVTGPEAGTVFWNGGINGTSPNFANWNVNEPNDCCSPNGGDENYAHITSPNVGNLGSWNDLPLAGDPDVTGDFHPRGYVVEYGGMPGDPVVNISASTKISFPSITSPIETTTVCGPQNVTLEAIPSDGDILWYNSINASTPIFTGNIFITPVIQATTSYFASVSVNGCTEGERVEFQVVVNQIPNVEPVVTFKNCDVDGTPDGITVFNLEELNNVTTTEPSNTITVTYHSSITDAEQGDNALTPFPYSNGTSNTVYGRVENINTGCFSVSQINLEVATTALSSDFVLSIDACENSASAGFSSFNLASLSASFMGQFPSGQNLSVHYYNTLADAQLEQNEIIDSENYRNKSPFSESIYVRIESMDNGDCFGIGPNVLLTVNTIPEFEIEQSEVFCIDGSPVVLSIVNPSDSGLTFEWQDTNGNIIGSSSTVFVDAEGVYSATATSLENCESAPVFYELLTSGVSTITLDDITVVDLSNNNTITIDVSNLGIGDYEFALDNEFGPYQEQSVFEGVQSGNHKLYVRDKNGCGITELEVFVLGFPKFFTPNGDLQHDTWNIIGLGPEYEALSTIRIYDRYGKFLKQINPGEAGWDGTFNGQTLAASDYWFVVNLVDASGNSRTFKGHFSLVR
ncbi:T9SS type B sorting domain-containing protein [Seonamhaeicola sp. ML3]|uniref:T9SS type B sorting domain-containing protein n=1 Tax=Seonamhaeicola sp. ML3 TaxID=2937786 RepID=UPI00200FB545|nr:T9SS type B sorting domain-containing protein [Seonamhaeicola sp. ML3]